MYLGDQMDTVQWYDIVCSQLYTVILGCRNVYSCWWLLFFIRIRAAGVSVVGGESVVDQNLSFVWEPIQNSHFARAHVDHTCACMGFAHTRVP